MRDPLTDQTRALLDLARDGDDPTADDRARLRQAVMLAVAGGAATGVTAVGAGTASASAALHASAASAASAASGAVAAGPTAVAVSSVAAGSAASAAGAVTAASVAGVTSLGALVTKAVLAIAAVGAVSVGVALGPSDFLEPSGPLPTDPTDPTDLAVRTSEVSASELHAGATRSSDAVALPGAPRVVEAAEVGTSPEANSGDEFDIEPSSRPAPSPASALSGPNPGSGRLASPFRLLGTSRRGAPTAAAAVPPEAAPPIEVAPSIGEEVVLLRRATAARRAGDAPRALALLDAHAQRFPVGVLTPERDAARVLTLCDLDRIDEGREAAVRFAADHPSSPLLGRVRAACQ